MDRCPNITTNFPQSSKSPVLTFAFNGACDIQCPNNYIGDSQTGLCLPCTDKRACDIRMPINMLQLQQALMCKLLVSAGCSGGTIQSLDDAKQFENCVLVEGHLEIRTGSKGQMFVIYSSVFLLQWQYVISHR